MSMAYSLSIEQHKSRQVLSLIDSDEDSILLKVNTNSTTSCTWMSHAYDKSIS